MLCLNLVRRILTAVGLLAIFSLAAAQSPVILWQYQGNADSWQPIDFSPDELTIVHGSYGQFRAHRVKNGEVVNSFGSPQTFGLSGLTYSPDSATIYAASFDLTLQNWSAEGNLLLTTWPNQWSNVAVSPDGTQLAVGTALSSGKVRILDAINHMQVMTFRDHVGPVYWIAFSPDGQYLATTGQDGKLIVRSLTPTRPTWTFQAHSGVARSLAFSPDGNQIVTGGVDGFARVWDLRSNQMVAQFPHSGAVHSVAWSADGRAIATASAQPAIRIFRTNPLAPYAVYTGEMGEGPLRVAFSRNSALFAYSRRDGKLVMAANPLVAGGR